MIFIVGRSGTGKDAFGKALQAKYNLHPVISYTNRPQRANEDQTYHKFLKGNIDFLSQKKNQVSVVDASNIHAVLFTDVIAWTQIGAYFYFATKKEFDKADYYVIDPKGLKTLLPVLGDLKQHALIYVDAHPKLVLSRIKDRAADPTESRWAWEARRIEENEQFINFEKQLEDGFGNRFGYFLNYHNNQEGFQVPSSLNEYIQSNCY